VWDDDWRIYMADWKSRYTQNSAGVIPRLVSPKNGAVMKIRESYKGIPVYLQTESCSELQAVLGNEGEIFYTFLGRLSSRICSRLFRIFGIWLSSCKKF
jgi:hypothetical protein